MYCCCKCQICFFSSLLIYKSFNEIKIGKWQLWRKILLGIMRLLDFPVCSVLKFHKDFADLTKSQVMSKKYLQPVAPYDIITVA